MGMGTRMGMRRKVMMVIEDASEKVERKKTVRLFCVCLYVFLSCVFYSHVLLLCDM